MSESVNPDNVNPHFDHLEEHGLYPPVSMNVEKSINLLPVPPVQPCPSCGHCPTCGRGPGITYYGPWWGYQPPDVICEATSGGEGATVTFGPIS
jgi:hypothetical protein